jgi:hypothetical protein
MTNAFRLQHPVPQPPEAAPTLATLAATIVTCPHPTASHVPFHVTATEEPVTWCGACGALGSDTGPRGPWRFASLPSRLTKKHFEEFALLLHSIHQLNLLAQAHSVPGAMGSPAYVHFRSLRSSLSVLSRLPLVRDLDRLEEAIALLPPTPPAPLP